MCPIRIYRVQSDQSERETWKFLENLSLRYSFNEHGNNGEEKITSRLKKIETISRTFWETFHLINTINLVVPP